MQTRLRERVKPPVTSRTRGKHVENVEHACSHEHSNGDPEHEPLVVPYGSDESHAESDERQPCESKSTKHGHTSETTLFILRHVRRLST
jgi:hypothetical protein